MAESCSIPCDWPDQYYKLHKLEWFPFVAQDNEPDQDVVALSRVPEDELALELNNSSLSKLIALPLAHFLSCAVGDASFAGFLHSFLESRNRWFDYPIWQLSGDRGGDDSDHRRQLVRLQEQVFVVLFRLFVSSVNDERSGLVELFPSNADKELGKLIYKRSVFNSSCLVDFCALYGHHNPKPVARICKSAVNMQPRLVEDTRKSFSTLDTLCANLLSKFQSFRIDVSEAASCDAEDMTMYVLDVFTALRQSLLALGVQNVIPVNDTTQTQQLLGSLCQAYNAAIPCIVEATSSHFADQVSPRGEYEAWRLTQIRTSFTSVLHTMLSHLYWDRILAQASAPPSKLVDSALDCLFYLLADMESDGYAMGDMFSECQVRKNVLDKLIGTHAEGNAEFDVARVEYLIQVIEQLPTSTRLFETATSADDPTRLTPLEPVSKRAESAQPQNSGPALDAKIKAVRDVLPHLGEYFTRRLLECVAFNTELAIQRVLENNIPTALEGVEFFAESGEDIEPINRGPATMNDLLNQVTISKEKRFAQVGLDDETEDNDDDIKELRDRIKLLAAKFSEYEDEYDDALDEGGIAVNDAGTSFETEGIVSGQDEVPTFVNPATWKPGMVDVDGNKRDADGKIIEEDEDDLLKPNMNRQQGSRLQRGQREDAMRGKGPRKPRRKKPAAAANGEAADQAAGGGGGDSRAKELRQRAKNDKQKSSRANHSRKTGAAKKAGKGMF